MYQLSFNKVTAINVIKVKKFRNGYLKYHFVPFFVFTLFTRVVHPCLTTHSTSSFVYQTYVFIIYVYLFEVICYFSLPSFS